MPAPDERRGADRRGRKRRAQDRPFSPQFLTWWDALPANPRKVNQEGAWKIWQVQRLDEQVDRVVKWTRGMATSYQWAVEGNIPLATTILNQKRYLAPLPREVTPPEPAAKPSPEQAAEAWRMERLGYLLADLERAVFKKHGVELKRAGRGAMSCLAVLEAWQSALGPDHPSRDFRPGYHPDRLVNLALERWEQERAQAAEA